MKITIEHGVMLNSEPQIQDWRALASKMPRGLQVSGNTGQQGKRPNIKQQSSAKSVITAT
jgi:hypothetical protein